jgi:hypothetical protein
MGEIAVVAMATLLVVGLSSFFEDILPKSEINCWKNIL